MRWLVLGVGPLAGCSPAPDCDRDPIVDAVPRIVGVGSVEVCPGDVRRYRGADEVSPVVFFDVQGDVEVSIDRYHVADGPPQQVEEGYRAGLGGPCWSEGELLDPEAYDLLVLEASGERGGWVEVTEVEELTCLVFAQEAPEVGDGG
jgi:hypothetical protein